MTKKQQKCEFSKTEQNQKVQRSRFDQRVVVRFSKQVLVAEGGYDQKLEQEAEEHQAGHVQLVGGELEVFEHKHLAGFLTWKLINCLRKR